ncbi:MAG: bifunctional phosphopantothenoylcysteine decarboxylase/phosphopantothenate--cysteine ligase CoaBC [Thermoproteus sp.]
MAEVEPIRYSYSHLLDGKSVVLTVTSGISLYRSIDLARLLIRHGADVTAVLSDKAARLVSPELFRWATGRRALSRLTGRAEHVSVCARADLLVVAPATANTVAKAALGIADDVATTCIHAALGAGARSVFVPTMNLAMWRNPALQEALSRLRSWGVLVVEPKIEEGKAKYPEVEEVAESVIDASAPRDMSGLRVLVTAGPTHEHIDDIKYISTPSSGLTGIYFAREAAARGAEVTLVAGPGVKAPPNVKAVPVVSVLDMYRAVAELAPSQDLMVFAAAPLDFYVAERASGKISSDVAEYTVRLLRAPKIAAEARRLNPKAYIVGFKAEYGVSEEELLRRARARMEEGGWDLVLAHDVSGLGFGTLKDQYIAIYSDGRVERLGPAHKRELARAVLDRAVKALGR